MEVTRNCKVKHEGVFWSQGYEVRVTSASIPDSQEGMPEHVPRLIHLAELTLYQQVASTTFLAQEIHDSLSDMTTNIQALAEEEAKQIIAEAEKKATDKLQIARQQRDTNITGAKKQAEEQVVQLRSDHERAISVQKHRRELKDREEVLRQVLQRVEDKFLQMVHDAGYRDILLNWTTEAAIGLNASEARISVSAAEQAYVDDAFIAEAQKKIEASGHRITLSFDKSAQAETRQGVVLYAGDGRTAYNNQVSSRIMRNGSEVRKLIFTKLFDSAAQTTPSTLKNEHNEGAAHG